MKLSASKAYEGYQEYMQFIDERGLDAVDGIVIKLDGEPILLNRVVAADEENGKVVVVDLDRPPGERTFEKRGKVEIIMPEAEAV